MDNSVGVPSSTLRQTEVNQLYDILQRFDAAAYEAGLKYSIACGTALGAVLRGGLIPWDTDADLIALHDQFYERLHALRAACRGQLVIQSYKKWSDGRGWYKIYAEGAPQEPNVDLYLLEYKPKENVWRPSDTQIVIRQNLYFDCDQINFTDRATFGPLRLPIFKAPYRFFDRYYGPKWRYADTKELADSPVRSLTRASATLDFRPTLPS
jgi:hypothetical protein